MKHKLTLLSTLLLASLAGSVSAQTKTPANPDPNFIATFAARLVALTCSVTVANQSRTPAKRFVFRVTTPPSDLAYQRARTFPVPGAITKTHENGVDRYIEFDFPVPGSSRVTHEIKSHVLLLPTDYTRQQHPENPRDTNVSAYLSPSQLVESDAPEIRAVAHGIFAGKTIDLEKARAAYEYPAKVIRFQPQPAAGALKALQTRSGDCTEFAALFCALCRAGGVPARVTGVFNMASKTEMTCKQPNHNAAEAFLEGWGWVPVDPNLGGGKFNRPVGFARTGNSVILLSRAGAWVWSTWLPPDASNEGESRPQIKVEVSWKMRVLMEGPPAQLLQAALYVAEEPATIRFTGGSGSEFQALLDRAPAGAVVVCEQAKPMEITKTLLVNKPMTLRGFKACLQPKLGKTPILIVDAEKVTLTDIEMRGNYDTVNQNRRAPLIHLKRGGFRIERCEFFDGSKDGIMVTPDVGTGDVVGGVIRDIEGSRIARDLVSLSGGNAGQRIRDVTLENIRLKTGFLRGAVEVSDGTDNIIVRHVVAKDAVYAIDVQDHGAVEKKTGKTCAPNTKVVLEDVTAVRCKHIIRTANRPLGHADLTLRDFTGRDCQEPVRISNTARVLIENLTITNEKPLDESPVELRNDQQVVIRNVTVKGTAEGVAPVVVNGCTDVKMERVTCNGAAVEQPATSTENKRKKDASTKKKDKSQEPQPK